MNTPPGALEEHFHFRENWQRYLKHVDDNAIKEAEAGLLKLVPADALKGATFLDIGCGSGLHSLAAWRLGAMVTSIDLDPDSVAATEQLRNREGADFTVRQQDVFDAKGEYDIVYSWGVLHHTGAMWPAIEHAAGLVKPGGLFAIALYQKTPKCGMWANIKRRYSKSGKLAQRAAQALYVAAFSLRQVTLGQNPIKYITGYKSSRGMNYFVDVHDWLGGYPYESASPEEVVAFFGKLGFAPLLKYPLEPGSGWFGSGCAEFTFRKRA